jgi:hypothetical protein
MTGFTCPGTVAVLIRKRAMIEYPVKDDEKSCECLYIGGISAEKQ